MGFIALPSVLHTKSLYRPDVTNSTRFVLTGVGGDANRVVWYSRKLLSWVITNKNQQGFPFDCVITIGATTLYPRANINNQPAWAGGGYTLYDFGGWRLVPDAYAGTILKPGTTTTWWSALGAVHDPSTATYMPLGAATGDPLVAHINDWRYWTSGTKTGIYTAQGAATGGNILVGTGKWTDSAGGVYIQSMEATELAWGARVMGFSNMTTSNGTTWIIGTEGSAEGWWEGPTPNINSPVLFEFKQLLDSEGAPLDPELEKPPRRLVFSGLTGGEMKIAVTITQTPLWRG